MTAPGNIFADLPGDPASEHFLTLLNTSGVKIERIVSLSHASPEGFWYEQDHDEWVLVLRGEAGLEFENGQMTRLTTGDHLLIAKHVRHRVARTSAETIWLAVHVTG